MLPTEANTPGHVQSLLSLMQSSQEDLTLISEEGERVLTWKLVLSLHSPTVACLLAESQGKAAMYLPFSRDILQRLVDGLVNGDVGGEELEENEAAVILGISDRQKKEHLVKENSKCKEQYLTHNTNASFTKVEKLKEEHFTDAIADVTISKAEKSDKCEMNMLSSRDKKNKVINVRKYKKKPKQRVMNNFNCELCDHKKGFLRTNLLQKHMLVKHNEPVVCSVCRVRFTATEKFVSHLKDKFHSSLTCEVCGDTFNNKVLLKNHTAWKHEEKERLPCSYCGMIVQNMNMHVKNRHENPIETCNLCDFKTRRTYSMKKHVKSVHTETYLQTCEFCGELRKNLKKHLLRTKCGEGKGVDERRSETCDECGKLFTTKDSLNKHTRGVHLKIKHMSCYHCDYATNSVFNLKLHVAKMHFGQNLEKEKCKFCSKVTHNLPYHSKIYHQGKQEILPFSPIK